MGKPGNEHNKGGSHSPQQPASSGETDLKHQIGHAFPLLSPPDKGAEPDERSGIFPAMFAFDVAGECPWRSPVHGELFQDTLNQ
jgi:hypothetical protein